MRLQIRETARSDRPDIVRIQRLAFGREDEAALTEEILDDPSARPLVSLLAFDDDRPVGHILFSRGRLTGPDDRVSASILAPLAVVPEAQGQGVGARLIAAGVRHLSQAGVDLVFVLGHPDYYPRHGFHPAGPFGLKAPYAIPDRHADAWMVRALRPSVIGTVRGRVLCCDALSRPEHWRE